MIKECLQFSYSALQRADVRLRLVVAATRDREILKPIVVANAIEVVDAFPVFKLAAKRLLNDESVFQHSAPLTIGSSPWRNSHVAVCVDDASAEPARMSVLDRVRIILAASGWKAAATNMRRDIARCAAELFGDVAGRCASQIHFDHALNRQALVAVWLASMSSKVINHTAHYMELQA